MFGSRPLNDDLLVAGTRHCRLRALRFEPLSQMRKYFLDEVCFACRFVDCFSDRVQTQTRRAVWTKCQRGDDGAGQFRTFFGVTIELEVTTDEAERNPVQSPFAEDRIDRFSRTGKSEAFVRR